MTSRHLYFKLLREDIKRKLWAAALLGLALFFSLPVAVAIALTDYQVSDWMTAADVISQRLSDAKKLLAFGTNYPLPMIILFFAAVVMGISTFSYLHNAKQVDFYHSLPVKRSLWFFVHVSTGILLTAVIYFAAVVLSLVVAAFNGVLPGLLLGTALFSFVCYMLYYCLIYMTVVLAVMLTGTSIAAVLGTAVFCFYAPAVSSMITAFCTTFLETYYYGSPGLWKRMLLKLSPLFAVVSAINEITLAKAVNTILAILILSVCCFFLYQKRPSEAAGKTMAFSWSKGMIKVFLVIAFGMAGAIFFYAIRESLGWTVFGVIVGVVISHCVIEVIYYADFKKVFFHEKTMALCMAGSLLIVLSFYFDWFGFDDYLPKENQVAYSSVDFNRDSWVNYRVSDNNYSDSETNYVLERSRIENSAPVIAIAQEAVRQQNEIKNAEEWSDSYYGQRRRITICYTLKSGRKVYRSYALDWSKIIDLADEIYLDAEYKKAVYPGITIESGEAAENMIYRDGDENIQTLQGSIEQRRAVADAYREDLINLSFSRRREENPIGEILLITNNNMKKLKSRYVNFNERNNYHSGYFDGFFYPVYPSFSRTIQTLEECGADVDFITTDDVENIMITAYGPFGENADETDNRTETSSKEEPYMLIYKDKEKIEKILETFVLSEGSWKNRMCLIDEQYDIELTINNQKVHGKKKKNGCFQKEKVPDFVIQDFLAEEKRK